MKNHTSPEFDEPLQVPNVDTLPSLTRNPTTKSTRSRKRTSQAPTFLQILNDMSNRPLRLSLNPNLNTNPNRYSTFTHSSIATELDSPSIYSVSDEVHTFRAIERDRRSRSSRVPPPLPPLPPLPSSAASTSEWYTDFGSASSTPTHTKQDSPDLSDPSFVQAIDEMSGKSLRLSLKRPAVPRVRPERKTQEIAEKQPVPEIVEDRKPVGLPTLPFEDTIHVDYKTGDPRKPLNFSPSTKWTITIVTCLFTFLASCAETSYMLGFPSMIHDINCTHFEAQLGSSLFACGLGLVPLLSAPLSERFGRTPVYISSGIGFSLMCLMIALAKNIQTVIIGRFLQGVFASTGMTIVVGSIADIWPPSERGIPLAIFALAVLSGNGLGATIAGWIEMNSRLGWRWIQWIQLIITGMYTVLLPFLLRETRSNAILGKMSKELRTKTGDTRYRAKVVEVNGRGKPKSVWGSCTRAIRTMFKPAILGHSAWLGLAWWVVTCVVQSIIPVFTSTHNFNNGEAGLVFLTLHVGSLSGFITHLLYRNTLVNQKDLSQQESGMHLYSACFAAFVLPAAVFMYAWTSFSHVHWIVPVIALTFFFWALFIIFIAIFSYLTDCYSPFASTALAAPNLTRNLSAIAFPLFFTPMLEALNIRWAGTLFGGIAIMIVPIPFLILSYERGVEYDGRPSYL